MTLRDLMAPVIRGDLYYATRPRRPKVTVDPSGVTRDTVDPSGVTRDMRSDAEFALWARARALPVSWIPEGATVLDVGCGPGKLKVARPDLDVYGYEPDEEDWKAALARGTLDWHGSMYLPRVDVLFLMDVVEHMAHPREDLERWLAQIGPGRTVIVECPDFWSPMAQLYGDRFRLLHDPDHVSLFTTESLVRMLRDLGVMIEDVAYPYFGGLYDTAENAAKQSAWADTNGIPLSPAAPGNMVAVRGRKR